jgi:hypothetical protein
LGDACCELDLLEECVSLKGKLAQGVFKIDIVEAAGGQGHAPDGVCAAAIAGRLLAVEASDGADRLAVLAEALSGALACSGQAVLRGWAAGVCLEGAVLFNGLVGERGDGAGGLQALIVDLGALDARDEEIVGQRRRRGIGGGDGGHCGQRAQSKAVGEEIGGGVRSLGLDARSKRRL